MGSELVGTRNDMSLQLIKAQEFLGGYPEILANNNYMSLRTVARNFGETETKQMMLVIFKETFGEGIDVNPDSIRLLINNIIEDYPDVSLQDVTYYAKRVLYGHFIGKEVSKGVTIKLFKYDVPTLCLMFQRYYSERLEVLEQIRESESHQQKLDDKTMHPDIAKLFVDAIGDQDKFKGIYENIEQYCSRNEIDFAVFQDAYSKLHEELKETIDPETNENKLPKTIFTGEYKSTKEITHPVFVRESEIELNDFVNYMCSQFLVIQNKIITDARINESYHLKKLIRFTQDYDINSLTEMCKMLGLWMIPTPYYYAAKKILFDGGEIKLRYDIDADAVKAIVDYIHKMIQDKEIKIGIQLFITAMLFNFTLNLNRFNKHNSNE